MKNFNRLSLLGLGFLLAFPSSSVWAQGPHTGSLNPGALPLDQIETLTMPAVDKAKLMLEDMQAAFDAPPRFAQPIPVQVTPQNHGTWENTGAGMMMWRVRIASPSAVSLNFGFTRYVMPAGGQLFIYTPDEQTVIGPFTEADNETHGQLWTPLLPGGDIIIEVTLPEAAVPQLELSLTSVNHGYVEFGYNPDKSGSCNLDVVCSAGDGFPQVDAWREEIRSVAAISLGGSLFCSGGLINNTAQDYKPFFLTAAHCNINSGNAASLVAYWNYQNSTCRAPNSAASGQSGNGSLTQFQTGSFFRAAHAASDMTLVELDDPINSAFGLHFAGWDRSGNNASSAVAIHHPNVEEKRISFEDAATSVTSYGGTAVPGDGTHVRVIDWDLGTTEPGSSGSPLFDQNRRVIGQLHGGNAACGNNFSDYYGRLFTSWTGGGTNATRLSNWLDPGNTGANVLNGISQTNTDLSITKTDSVTSATPGQSVIYTITASNAGPSADPNVTVADTFPASCVTTSWTCAGAGGGICAASGSGNINGAVNLPIGGSVTYTASCTIAATATGTLSNTATVSSTITDPTPANNSATDTDTLSPSTDLVLTKTDSPDPVVVGNNLTYSINATNNGPSAATGVTVTDTLPANVTLVSVSSSQGSCSGTATVTCNLGNLNNGANATATIVVTPTAAAVPSLSNTASVSGTETDPTPGNNSATATTTVSLPSADLALTKTDGVTSAIPGQPVTYTITASNAGPSAAPSASVADTLPAACVTPDWTCTGAGGGTCSASGIGNINDTVNLPSGGSVTYTASCSIAPTATGTLSNTATVSSSTTSDPTPGNNSATDSDTLTPSTDVSITKTDGLTSATPGQSVTYTITASNAGPSAAPTVTVADTFPASCVTPAWTCTGAGDGVCTASGSGNINDTVSLPRGASVTYTASCSIAATATGTLSNTATVSSSITDPTPGNNSATDSDTLSPSTDLALTKTDSPDPVIVGNNLTYTITATNNGSSAATGVVITDTLPANVTLVSATSSQGSCSGIATVSCTIGSLNNGANATATIVVTPTVAGPLSNTASVSGTENDPRPGNNSATATTTVNATLPPPPPPALADLAITKIDSSDPVIVGDVFAYTMSVTNNGPGTANGVVVSDTLPAGVTFIQAAPSQGACTSTTTVTCNLGSLTNGATATVKLYVIPTAAGVLSNTASVTGTSSDPNNANNQATESTTVNLPTCNGLTATIVGTIGNDTLNGTAGRDIIVGLGGNDVINGLDGNDVICGGKGNDRLRGNAGRDTLEGGSGSDRLEGGAGNDRLNGGTLSDNCIGGPGTDTATACENISSVP